MFVKRGLVLSYSTSRKVVSYSHFCIKIGQLYTYIIISKNSVKIRIKYILLIEIKASKRTIYFFEIKNARGEYLYNEKFLNYEFRF